MEAGQFHLQQVVALAGLLQRVVEGQLQLRLVGPPAGGGTDGAAPVSGGAGPEGGGGVAPAPAGGDGGWVAPALGGDGATAVPARGGETSTWIETIKNV